MYVIKIGSKQICRWGQIRVLVTLVDEHTDLCVLVVENARARVRPQTLVLVTSAR